MVIVGILILIGVIALAIEYPLWALGFAVMIGATWYIYHRWERDLPPDQRAARRKAEALRVAEYRRQAEERKSTKEPELVPSLDGQGWMCPTCHGKQFKARRSPGQRAAILTWGAVTLPVSAIGGGLVAAKFIKKRVQCMTCQNFFMTPDSPPDYIVEGDY